MPGIELAPLPTVESDGDLLKYLEILDSNFEEVANLQTRYTWAKIFKEPYEDSVQGHIDAAKDQLYTAAIHETLKTWRDKTSDPKLKRWTEVLDNQYTVERVDQNPELRNIINFISDRYIRWRPSIDGEAITYTEHTRINRLDPDRTLREKAYLSLSGLGDELDGPTRQMFHLRNEKARELGYPTYADLKLELLDDVDRSWIIAQFNAMEATTSDIFAGYLMQQAGMEDLPSVQPWDSQYLLDRDSWPDSHYYPADNVQANLWQAATSLGVDREKLGISFTFYDSAAGGQCMTLGGDDIRVLTNKGDGMLHYNTAFHEFGHAIHSAYYDQPYTLRKESSLFTEGIAMFMERFLHYPTWMRRSGVPEREIELHRQNWRLPRIYRHRRLAPMVMAELAMWDDPDTDIDRIFGEETARWLGTEYQPRSFAAITRWTSPIRLQSYFIADLVASQSHAWLRANLPRIYDSPEAIAHAREHYLAPGNSIPWRQKMINATGADLSYDALARDMEEPYPEVL